MRKFFKLIWQKYLAHRNRKLEETEAKTKRHEEFEKLKKLQEKKRELDRLRHDKGQD